MAETSPPRHEPERPQPGPTGDRRVAAEPLWREALGERLRQQRHSRREKLTDTARRAGVSPQYLSEIERGVKEPSSEMIAAVTGALGLTLFDLTLQIAKDLSIVRPSPAQSAPYAPQSAYALAA